jgi:hypothetical protein
VIVLTSYKKQGMDEVWTGGAGKTREGESLSDLGEVMVLVFAYFRIIVLCLVML